MKSKSSKLAYIIIIIVFIFVMLSAILTNDKANKNIDPGFTINSYDVVLNVQKDNKVLVEENIDVNWHETNHHGIYRMLPEWLKYTGKDLKTISRKSKIKNIEVSKDKSSISWEDKKYNVKIGNENSYVSLGNKTYNISYTCDMGQDPYEGYDEFIFHVYGDYWQTDINNPSLQVNMPKSIEGYKVNFYTDKYRENNITNYVDYKIIGNTLYAQLKSDIYDEDYFQTGDTTNPIDKLSTALTVDIELPENYFEGGSWNYGWWTFYLLLAIIIMTLFTIIRWIKHGKDFPKQVKTVEFYPPYNLSAAEIGYIYNNGSPEKLTIALIVQLASKGYIQIDEGDIGSIIIKNLIPKPKDETIPKRIIGIKKLKGIDSKLSSRAQYLMAKIFGKEKQIKLDTNINEFLNVKDELISGGYIQIESDNELTRFENPDDKLKYLKQIEEYNKKISQLKPLSEYEQIVYNGLFIEEDEIDLTQHKTLYKSINDVHKLLAENYLYKISDKKASKKYVFSILITCIEVMLFVFAYALIEDMDPSLSFMYSIGILSIILNIFFTHFMERKTKYGEDIAAKINGFKDFLTTAQKPELEELVMKNPSYFYDILPYTYVLDVSKKWIEKFEDIQMQKKDLGTLDFSNDASVHSMSSRVFSESSGGSSGGCSSCGRGCSSCGGGGSW